jgi:hypothetical protein
MTIAIQENSGALILNASHYLILYGTQTPCSMEIWYYCIYISGHMVLKIKHNWFCSLKALFRPKIFIFLNIDNLYVHEDVPINKFGFWFWDFDLIRICKSHGMDYMWRLKSAGNFTSMDYMWSGNLQIQLSSYLTRSLKFQMYCIYWAPCNLNVWSNWIWSSSLLLNLINPIHGI